MWCALHARQYGWIFYVWRTESAARDYLAHVRSVPPGSACSVLWCYLSATRRVWLWWLQRRHAGTAASVGIQRLYYKPICFYYRWFMYRQTSTFVIQTNMCVLPWPISDIQRCVLIKLPPFTLHVMIPCQYKHFGNTYLVVIQRCWAVWRPIDLFCWRYV